MQDARCRPPRFVGHRRRRHVGLIAEPVPRRATPETEENQSTPEPAAQFLPTSVVPLIAVVTPTRPSSACSTPCCYDRSRYTNPSTSSPRPRDGGRTQAVQRGPIESEIIVEKSGMKRATYPTFRRSRSGFRPHLQVDWCDLVPRAVLSLAVSAPQRAGDGVWRPTCSSAPRSHSLWSCSSPRACSREAHSRCRVSTRDLIPAVP